MSETDSAAAASAGLRVRGVRKSFGQVEAVRGIDLEIRPSETVALLGPNGAGKSTTLDLILGLTRPDDGEIEVFGLPPADAVATGRVAAMLQTGAPLSFLTVRELVDMFASLYPSPLDVDETLALTGLTSIAGRRTQALSGGQAQRVRFATTLVADADLLVLDEPTVALDVESRREFWEAMRAVAARGRTIVFATHYLEEADAFADRIVLMAGGQIVADGSAASIKARVGRRTIRCTLPSVPDGTLLALPGVAGVQRVGDVVTLSCTDSDEALRALLHGHPTAADIEVRGAALEDAFVELTSDPGRAP